MAKKDLETKAMEAVIEMKGFVKGIYEAIGDLTLSLYHVITDRRDFRDAFYKNKEL